ncbi:MAG: hypothetical protein IPL49_22165 [Saprospirales bacterium]|nr:hypothetical protein [Saprospirales bacterium]
MSNKRLFCCIITLLVAWNVAVGNNWEEPPYLSKTKRFYFSPYGSMNITSAATTNALGLEDDYSGKWNFGARFGYWFWFPKKWSFALETGASYRDFGFSQNQSTIPYISIPATLRIQIGKGFLRVNIYGSAEFNRLYAPMYEYPDPANPPKTTHNLFLHQNDAITGLYGMGFLLGKGASKWSYSPKGSPNSTRTTYNSEKPSAPLPWGARSILPYFKNEKS